MMNYVGVLPNQKHENTESLEADFIDTFISI